MEPIILRGIERLVGVIIGGAAIYLGYRLFIELPKQTDSSGKIVLPGGVSVFLSRIGPGAFFALFGAVLVAISFHHAVQVDLPAPTRAGPNAALNAGFPAGRQTHFRGAAGGLEVPDDVTLQSRRSEAYGMMEVLNQLPALLPENLASEKRIDIRQALTEGKLALIQSVWGTDWGDFTAFRKWIEANQPTPVPEAFTVPARLLAQGASPKP